MADKKLSQLTESTTYDANTSYVIIVDESDTAQAATGSNYKVKVSGIVGSSSNNSVGRTAVTGNYSHVAADHIIAVDSASACTITLLDPTSHANKLVIIKDEGGNATSAPITITTIAGTIDGVSSIDLTVSYSAVHLYSSGSNWHLI